MNELWGKDALAGGGFPGGLLRDGNLVGLAVDGRRGGEQHVVAAVQGGGFQDVQEGGEVVLVVHHRLLDGFADRLECGEVDNGVDGVSGEQGPGRLSVAEVHLLEGDVIPSGNLFRAFVAGQVAVGEVVGHDDVVTGLDEFHGHVASDEARSARYKNCLFHMTNDN